MRFFFGLTPASQGAGVPPLGAVRRAARTLLSVPEFPPTPPYFPYQSRRRTSMPVPARALANPLVSDPL